MWTAERPAFIEDGADSPMADIDWWDEKEGDWWLARIQVCGKTKEEADALAQQIVDFLNERDK